MFIFSRIFEHLSAGAGSWNLSRTHLEETVLVQNLRCKLLCYSQSQQMWFATGLLNHFTNIQSYLLLLWNVFSCGFPSMIGKFSFLHWAVFVDISKNYTTVYFNQFLIDLGSSVVSACRVFRSIACIHFQIYYLRLLELLMVGLCSCQQSLVTCEI